MTVAMPLSMVAFGPLADRYAVETLLVVAGALLTAFVLVVLAIPTARRSLAAVSRPVAAPDATTDDADASAAEVAPSTRN